MHRPDWAAPLDAARERALRYLEGLPERPVGASAGLHDLRTALGGPLPEHPSDPSAVVAELAAAVEPGLMASGSGRFFGFVFGGTMPVALAADWLTSAWDQNPCLYVASPAGAVAEEVAGSWLAELLGLPPTVSVGFVTGAQQANATGLAAARHALLERVGWDVEARGLAGAPVIRVLVGAERHATIDRAVRYLGIGTDALVPVAADEQGRMRPDALRAELAAATGPTIVCAQAGNVNTGAVDPLDEVCAAAHAAGAWVHVDGAFGLWAGASPRTRSLVAGVELADSWATDAHKWLNVPYDSGLVFVADRATHHAAMGVRASYLLRAEDGGGDGMDTTPEASRRARAFPAYAALRALGRQGVTDLVDRCCALARRFADRLGALDGVEVLNDVVLNQVLVRFSADDPDDADADADVAAEADDALTRAIVAGLQHDGTCWVGGTTWHGRAAVRISVSNWSTDEEDVDRTVEAFARCAHAARAAASGGRTPISQGAPA